MTLVIGVDEAGYGPNLGPLAIGLSAWQVPAGVAAPARSRSRGATATLQAPAPPQVNLYRLLRRGVASEVDGRRVAIADSKRLYKPGAGIAALERGVLATDAAAYELFDRHAADQIDLECEPFTLSAQPCSASDKQVARFRKCLHAVGARPLPLAARLMFAGEFNDLVAQHGTKGTLLSHATLGLVREAIDCYLATAEPAGAPQQICVTCDKHGGRNNYSELLVHFFPEWSLLTLAESRPVSRYLLTRGDAELHITFRSKGEEQLETALASMLAKYLRELAMGAFNRFWCRQVPGLKPTAGYPNDAVRFKEQIAHAQARLGIDDHVVWRCR